MRASDLVGRRVAVEVPATIANLGAGYDCLGLAVDLGLRADVEVVARDGGPAVQLEVTGEGVGEISTGRGNRLVEALEAGLRDRRVEPDPTVAWRIRMTNEIPLARGLGSSGAAAVAGLLAAEAFAGGPGGRGVPGADLDTLLDRATALEGHPDNVAPALLGGFVATLAPKAYRFDAPPELRIVLYVPTLHLSTSRMRAALPDSVPRADAVANLARVAVGVAGIASGDWSVLARLTEDRLHEPYRARIYPQLPIIATAARRAGALGACLAGGGSTIAAFCLGSAADVARIGEAMRAAAAASDLPGAVRLARARNEGARILEG
ncbi:MAG TPA: homoserine kinase [Candidatus Limnocylindrales bacterium]|nr:homoserine kinase [Candidatus Limnocylindrales bacterium]